MPPAKLCRMRGEMAVASQMRLAQHQCEKKQYREPSRCFQMTPISSKATKAFSPLPGATASVAFAEKPIRRRPSTVARMAAIHHVDHRQAAGVSRYFATFVRASDKLSGGGQANLASRSSRPRFTFLAARVCSRTSPLSGRQTHWPPAPSAGRVRHVEPLDDGDQLDVHPVEIDHHLSGVGDRAA